MQLQRLDKQRVCVWGELCCKGSRQMQILIYEIIWNGFPGSWATLVLWLELGIIISSALLLCMDFSISITIATTTSSGETAIQLHYSLYGRPVFYSEEFTSRLSLFTSLSFAALPRGQPSVGKLPQGEHESCFEQWHLTYGLNVWTFILSQFPRELHLWPLCGFLEGTSLRLRPPAITFLETESQNTLPLEQGFRLQFILQFTVITSVDLTLMQHLHPCSLRGSERVNQWPATIHKAKCHLFRRKALQRKHFENNEQLTFMRTR